MYFLSLIDDFSRKVWTYPLKSKDQAFECFKNWKVKVETQTERKVQFLRTDNGPEFLSNNVNFLCNEFGISRHRTVAYTPQQNGVAESMNRTLMERVRCMISEAKITENF